MPESRPRQQSEQKSGFLWSAAQSVAIFMAVQFVMKQFLGGNSKTTTVNTPRGSVPAYSPNTPAQSVEAQYSEIPQFVSPMWQPDALVDMSMYISSSAIMPSLSSAKMDTKIFEEKGIQLDDWKATRDVHTNFKVPEQVQNNGTLFGHIYVALSGYALDPAASTYDQTKSYHISRPLNQYLKKKKVRKTRNLLAGEEQKEDPKGESEYTSGQTITSYYHPNLTISVIPDFGTQPFAQMHPAVRQWVTLESTGVRDETGQHSWYYPVLFVNDFWQLRSHMMELNDTVTELPINIHLNTLSFWKFNLLTTWDHGMKENAKAAANGSPGLTGSSDGGEFEQIKQILLDSNPYLLITTGVVTVLHLIFEMLAFKSDVSHWRNKKDNVGVSFRSILGNVFMQAVIFLYLLDNNENTSWMILMSQGMGIVLEAWKVTKTVNVRVRPTQAGSRNPLPYSIIFEDKHKLSETEKKTQEADAVAFKYLYIISVPLLIAYAGYSLYYETHRSWYSFVIAVLVGSVYAYGFLMMVPSLYINYKLKSVAHMPAKAMMYKTLNTFIDDLFAFTIKMPLLHRLATLRDDVIFFVYLYQAWKYKVDYTRVNEFGQGGDDDASVAETVAVASPTNATAGKAANGKTLLDRAEVKAEERGSGKPSGRETGGGRKRK